MAGTRSSNRISSSPQSEKATNGTKRKADDASPSTSQKAKRGRPSKASKQQKTIEETLPATGDQPESEDVLIKDAEEAEHEANGEDGDETKATSGENAANGGDATNGAEASDQKMADGTEVEQENAAVVTKGEDESHEKTAEAPNAFDKVKADDKNEGTTSKTDESKVDDTNAGVTADAIEEDKEREKAQPSNVLEKGIIYFFTRGRVGITEPESVQELQRSFFVMRPLPEGGKITDGAIQDIGNNRLLALPKKVWPKSGKDRFMVFVEKASVTMETLKEEFFSGSDYDTKTVGTRHTPEVTPIGEGVYALVSTPGSPSTTHLAYMLTIPTEMGEVQKDVGLAAKGSFVVSAKNPESSGPANAQLAEAPAWPKEFIEEFGSRGWMPAKPKYLDYANAQMLLIGEDFEKIEPTPKDQKDDNKETPQEELKLLEHEDELRVEHISGNDTVFADLGISSKDYPSVKTTW